MREIKFRVWDEENDEMVYEAGITPEGIPYTIPSHSESFDQFNYYPHCHKMQYSGLKDKNGVEIYEGDVVATDDYTVAMFKHWEKKTEEKISLYEIRFFEGRYMLFDKSNWVAVLNHHVMSKADQLTVVGNIYESPELLEVAE